MQEYILYVVAGATHYSGGLARPSLLCGVCVLRNGDKAVQPECSVVEKVICSVLGGC